MKTRKKCCPACATVRYKSCVCWRNCPVCLEWCEVDKRSMMRAALSTSQQCTIPVSLLTPSHSRAQQSKADMPRLFECFVGNILPLVPSWTATMNSIKKMVDMEIHNHIVQFVANSCGHVGSYQCRSLLGTFGLFQEVTFCEMSVWNIFYKNHYVEQTSCLPGTFFLLPSIFLFAPPVVDS